MTTLIELGYAAFPGTPKQLGEHCDRLINASPIKGYRPDGNWRRWKRSYQRKLTVSVLKLIIEQPERLHAAFAGQLLRLDNALEMQGYMYPGYYDAASPTQKRGIGHEDECPCRWCTTPST